MIDLRRAEARPRHAVVASAAAGCDPVRVATSPSGNVVWVTARESNALLGFSASRLHDAPSHALIARVQVGAAPVGLVVLPSGGRVVVADSDRFYARGRQSGLTVVDTASALAHRPAIVGTIPAGGFPRELSDIPSRHRLMVTNFASDQLESVDTEALR